jgi:hypothetical protein
VNELLSEWCILQEDANYIDHLITIQMQTSKLPCSNQPNNATFYTHNLFCWVFNQIVTLLSHEILLGFENQLYTPNEIQITYW